MSARLHLQPFTAPGRSRVSKWSTPVVAVIPTYDATRPVSGNRSGWMRNDSHISFVIYQRRYPSQPNYSPNIGFEAGVHIQFVLDHYDDLPSQTAFLTDDTSNHNAQVRWWLACLLPETNYAPLTLIRLRKKDALSLVVNSKRHLNSTMVAAGYARRAALVEQCWRNMLSTFGKSHILPPRARPAVAFYQGSYFAASAAQLQRHPRTTWAAAHALFAGGDGRCHHGEPRWEELYHHQRTGETLTRDSLALSKHTHGGWELWQHVLVGGMKAYAPIKFDFCHAFSAQPGCPRSPCKPGAAWLPPSRADRRDGKIMRRGAAQATAHHTGGSKLSSSAQ